MAFDMAAIRLRMALLIGTLGTRLPYRLVHLVDVARAALEAEKERGRLRRRSRQALEFLPAALEVLESPPSPLGRALGWLLMALFAIGLGWSILGQVDVVATAQGRIIPSGRTKVVQPLEPGVIKAIRVRDGDHVVAGQVLIELDPTQASADRESLLAQLAASRAESARFAAQAAGNPIAAFRPPPGLPSGIVEQNRRVLAGEVAALRARAASLDGEVQRAQADLSATRATVGKLEKAIPLLRERVEAKAGLVAQGYSPRLAQLEQEQQLVEMEQELVAQRHRLRQAAAQLDSARENRVQASADFQRNALAQQQEADKRTATLTQDLAKAESRRGLQTLAAPIAGTVQDLAIHTEGGVVSPAQKLLSIVPDESGLEIEARLLNRDIGFVAMGQEAEIKLDAFPYTLYGLLPGRVVNLSRDAIEDSKAGLVYPVRVELLRTSVEVNGRPVPLGPGMVATVEIKTEQRRIIEFLLSPIARYRHDSMRER